MNARCSKIWQSSSYLLWPTRPSRLGSNQTRTSNISWTLASSIHPNPAWSPAPAFLPWSHNRKPGGLVNVNSGTAVNNNGDGAAKRNPRRQQQSGATGNTNGGAANNAGASGNNKNNGATGAANQGTHANPMNAIPAGNPNPISNPGAGSLAACLAICQGNPAYVVYTFASGACKLFG